MGLIVGSMNSLGIIRSHLMGKRKLKNPPPDHPAVRKAIRDRVQGWFMAYNDRLTDAPELTMTLQDEFTLGRHHLEHLTDWITDRIIEGGPKEEKQ
jgi:hypothetical protein